MLSAHLYEKLSYPLIQLTYILEFCQVIGGSFDRFTDLIELRDVYSAGCCFDERSKW